MVQFLGNTFCFVLLFFSLGNVLAKVLKCLQVNRLLFFEFFTMVELF